MLQVFTFAFDTETKQAATGGNIDALMALRVLQDIVIALAIAEAKKIEAQKIEAVKSEGNPE